MFYPEIEGHIKLDDVSIKVLQSYHRLFTPAGHILAHNSLDYFDAKPQKNSVTVSLDSRLQIF